MQNGREQLQLQKIRTIRGPFRKTSNFSAERLLKSTYRSVTNTLVWEEQITLTEIILCMVRLQ